MLEKLRVLLVDDDPNILDLLKTYLAGRGYAAEARRSAREGLEQLRDGEFDLVISDGQMAEMDGFEFIHIVRANHPEIGIILMTAYEGQFPLSESLKAGADGYITKPFSLRKFSLIFERAYWSAISREDWWDSHAAATDAGGDCE